MRILLVVGGFYPKGASGITTVISEVVKRLEKKHEIFILAHKLLWRNEPTHDITSGNTPILRLRPPLSLPKTNLYFYDHIKQKRRAIKKLIKKFEPDVIYAHNRLEFYSARDLDVPIVGHVHSIYTKHFLEQDRKRCIMPHVYWEWFWKYIQRLEHTALSSCKKVITYSEYLAELSKQRGAEEVIIIPNGIDIKIFNPEGKRFEYQKRPAVIFVGRIERVKGIPYLLKAARNMPEINFYLIGNKVDNYVYPQNVFCLGAKSNQEIPEYLRGANLFINPVIRDGFEMAIMEALACSLPAITTRAYERERIYGNAVHYIKPADSSSIANAIQILLNDVKLRNKLREEGFKLSQKYDWDHLAKRIENVLIEVAK